MRKDEVVKKNISLVFDFLRYLTDHPELLEKLPEGCELALLNRTGALTVACSGNRPYMEFAFPPTISFFAIKIYI